MKKLNSNCKLAFGGKINKEDYGSYGAGLGYLGATANTLSNKTDGQVSVGGKVAAGALSGASAGMALGPIGAGVGAVIGGVVSGLGAAANNKHIIEQQEEVKRQELINRNNMINDYSRAVYNNYPTQGINGAQMYKFGGRLPYKLPNGGLMPLSPTVSQAVGDNHGVDSDGDGKEGVPVGNNTELENKEVVYIDALGQKKVLSSRLGVADMARKLMASSKYMMDEGAFKKKVENIHKQQSKAVNDKFTTGTLNERLKGIRHPLDDLYDQQEQVKQQAGLNNQPQEQQQMKYGGTIKYPYGGIEPKKPIVTGGQEDSAPELETRFAPLNKLNTPPVSFEDTPNLVKPLRLPNSDTSTIGYKENITDTPSDTPPASKNTLTSSQVVNGVATAANFVDNAYNAYLNSRRPKVPTPILNRAVPLNTTYSIDPMLEENKKQLRYLNKNIDQTTNNPQVARANKIAGFVGTLKQQNALQGTKINTENQLSNNNRLNTQQVNNVNTDILNNNNMNKLYAKDDIMLANSENVANAVDKVNILVRQGNMKELDNKKLDIIMAKYKTTGVLTRTDVDYINELAKNHTK